MRLFMRRSGIMRPAEQQRGCHAESYAKYAQRKQEKLAPVHGPVATVLIRPTDHAPPDRWRR